MSKNMNLVLKSVLLFLVALIGCFVFLKHPSPKLASMFASLQNRSALIQASQFKKSIFSDFKNVLRVSSGHPSQESLHVEYPTVYKVNDLQIMLYSAYGDDGRWRIKEATSKGDNNWVKQGSVFAEAQLTFKGNYAFPFVFISDQANTSERYQMVFAAGKNNQESYTQLWQSFSKDGEHWNQPQKILEDSLVLDPVVTEFAGKRRVIYTSMDKAKTKNSIKMVVLSHPQSTAPKIIYIPKIFGIYTLGIFDTDHYPVFVVESGNQRETQWIAKCFDKNFALINAAKQPLLITPHHGEHWDSLKYGPYFYKKDKQSLVLYYNGIKGRGEESGGQIGFAKIDMALLEKSLEKNNCYF